VDTFHIDYFKNNYLKGKDIFLSKEASNYVIMSKHLTPEIFTKYKEIISQKQFYIREPFEKLESYEQMLDKMTEQKCKDVDILIKFIKDNELEETLSDKIDMNPDTYLNNELDEIRNLYINFVDEVSKKYEKLYINFAVIFLKVLQRTMDIGILTMYLGKIRDIENNRTTQDKASIEIGQKMFDKYVKK
jgi:hypothetical protein